MKVEGTKVFDAPRDAVWGVLMDPEKLAKLLPGVDGFDIEDDTHWNAKVRVPLGMGGLKLGFAFEKVDEVPPERASLRAKGKGVGLALLRALVRKAETLGFRQMVAVIGDGSPQSPSVRLHLRAGFRHCGQLRGSGYKHGRWLDTIFMQLAMNGGSSSPPDADSLPERQFRRSARR